MKVREFMRYFKEKDLDKELLVASDSEGNSYHHIDEVCHTDEGMLVIFPTDEVVEVDEGDEDEGTEPGAFQVDEENGIGEQDAPHSKDNRES